MCDCGENCPGRKTAEIILVCYPHQYAAGRENTPTIKVRSIDECLADIIIALNKGGVTTFQSCCAHGLGHGFIELMDGRTLVIKGKRNANWQESWNPPKLSDFAWDIAMMQRAGGINERVPER